MFEDFDEEQNFDLIYFDAFGARVQPELWTEAIFRKMYLALRGQWCSGDLFGKGQC